MAILNKLTWIDSAALTRFILSAQVRRRTFTRLKNFGFSGCPFFLVLFYVYVFFVFGMNDPIHL